MIPIDIVTSDSKLPDRAAVVVIGGGIAGVCTALELAERRIDVVLVEVPNPGHPYGVRGVGEHRGRTAGTAHQCDLAPFGQAAGEQRQREIRRFVDVPHLDDAALAECRESDEELSEAVAELERVKADLRMSQILTRKAFENAIRANAEVRQAYLGEQEAVTTPGGGRG